MIKQVSCSDWHRGWGYGGHDRVGTLWYDSDTGIFTWKGRSHGRHGRSWGSATTEFKLTEHFYSESWEHDKIEYLSESHKLPDFRDVRAAVEILLKPAEPCKTKQKTKTSCYNSQQQMNLFPA